jgi:hypothetical protein
MISGACNIDFNPIANISRTLAKQKSKKWQVHQKFEIKKPCQKKIFVFSTATEHGAEAKNGIMIWHCE